nr:uncharacterized protein LOC119179143 [Rhipicephalus microplus]
MCVQSCLIGRRHHVYKREIMYFNKKRKVQMIHGPKIERKAYLRVLRREVDDRPILVVDAFMGRNETDPKVSGRYDIFFASEVCFVMGTPVVDPSTVRYRADRREAGMPSFNQLTALFSGLIHQGLPSGYIEGPSCFIHDTTPHVLKVNIRFLIDTGLYNRL